MIMYVYPIDIFMNIFGPGWNHLLDGGIPSKPQCYVYDVLWSTTRTLLPVGYGLCMAHLWSVLANDAGQIFGIRPMPGSHSPSIQVNPLNWLISHSILNPGSEELSQRCYFQVRWGLCPMGELAMSKCGSYMLNPRRICRRERWSQPVFWRGKWSACEATGLWVRSGSRDLWMGRLTYVRFATWGDEHPASYKLFWCENKGIWRFWRVDSSYNLSRPFNPFFGRWLHFVGAQSSNQETMENPKPSTIPNFAPKGQTVNSHPPIGVLWQTLCHISNLSGEGAHIAVLLALTKMLQFYLFW